MNHSATASIANRFGGPASRVSSPQPSCPTERRPLPARRWRARTWRPVSVLLALLIGAAATPSTAPGQMSRVPDEVEREEPAVLAILETEPSTPAELTRAAKILADLGRPDLGKQMLQAVIKAKPGKRELAALAEQFGTDLFTSLASRPALAPEGQQVADAVLTAYRQLLQEPKRLAGLVAQLGDDSAEAKYRALAGLLEGRAASVPPLLAALADPQRADIHREVLGVLKRLGSDAVGPLLAALESDDQKRVAAAARGLGVTGATDKALYLFHPLFAPGQPEAVRQAAARAMKRLVGALPERSQATRILQERARDYFEQRIPMPTDGDGNAHVWIWNAQQQRPVEREYEPHDASLVLAARLARHAHRIEPGSAELRLLYLATGLELASYAAGLDEPLKTGENTAAATVIDFGPGVVEELLEFGLNEDHPPVAAAAARILGRIGSPQRLLHRGSRPTPLVEATEHADPRVRLAAVEAIMHLEPTMAYAGSSSVLNSMAFFVTGSGQRVAIVGGRGSVATQHVVGFLAGMGYDAEPASVGVDLVRRAIATSDVELVLLDATIEKPAASLVRQQLRRDYRTARIPLGVIAPAGSLEAAERIAREDPLTEAFPRPRSQEAAEWQVARLQERTGRRAFGADERLAAAEKSLDWLLELAERDTSLYNLLSVEPIIVDAAWDPPLARQAVRLLGHFGTGRAQQTLVDVASRFTLPVDVRREAVAAFCRSVEQYGIRLTTPSIEQQYDRYNRSATKDRVTQQLLGLILDCIEAPTAPLETEEADESES